MQSVCLGVQVVHLSSKMQIHGSTLALRQSAKRQVQNYKLLPTALAYNLAAIAAQVGCHMSTDHTAQPVFKRDYGDCAHCSSHGQLLLWDTSTRGRSRTD